MSRLSIFVAAALLTAFGACTDGQPKTQRLPEGVTARAAEPTQVALELPGMD